MTKRRVGKKYTIQQLDIFQIDIDHSLMTDFLSLGIQQRMLLNIVSENIHFFTKIYVCIISLSLFASNRTCARGLIIQTGAVPLRIVCTIFQICQIYDESHELVKKMVEVITFAGCIRIVRKRYETIRNPTTLDTIDVRQHPYM